MCIYIITCWPKSKANTNVNEMRDTNTLIVGWVCYRTFPNVPIIIRQKINNETPGLSHALSQEATDLCIRQYRHAHFSCVYINSFRVGVMLGNKQNLNIVLKIEITVCISQSRME